jgi:hypothetical protein
MKHSLYRMLHLCIMYTSCMLYVCFILREAMDVNRLCIGDGITLYGIEVEEIVRPKNIN